MSMETQVLANFVPAYKNPLSDLKGDLKYIIDLFFQTELRS